VAEDLSLTILAEVPPPPGTPPPEPLSSTFSLTLKEILKTSAGKKFANKIKENNIKLKDAGLQTITIEPLTEEIQEPEYYSIVGTVTPTNIVGGAP